MARRQKKTSAPLWLIILASLVVLVLRGLPEPTKDRPERETKQVERVRKPNSNSHRTRESSHPSTPTLEPDEKQLPPSNIADFDAAKRELRRLFSRGRDFYCGCSYDFTRKPNVDPSSCGLRSTSERAKRIEWEHVVPASFYGRQFTAWKKGDPSCRGRDKRGRECARKVSPAFRQIEGDLYNLMPAVGELNRARSDKSYGMIAGEPREYGACDFETLGGITEPKEDIRGDIARIYFYMDARYPEFGIVNASNLSLLEEWAKADPIDAREQERVRKIEAVQGNSFFIGRLAKSRVARQNSLQ